MTRPGTATARLLVTAALAGDPESYGQQLAAQLCAWDVLDEAAHLAYLTAGACLALDGAPHSRADIAAAWAAARPGIADRLVDRFGASVDLFAALEWCDAVLGGASAWWIPAHDPEAHLAVMLAVVVLIWGGRPDASWRRVCLALADSDPA